MKYEIENGYIDIREKSIVYEKDSNIFMLKILNKNNIDNGEEIICIDIENSVKYQLTIENGKCTIRCIENNILDESINNKNRKAIKNIILKFTKYLIIIIIAIGFLYVIINTYNNYLYEEQVKNEENLKNDIKFKTSEFILENYIGSYSITEYERNEERILIFPKSIGRIDLAKDKIDIMIDYNHNTSYDKNEIETHKIKIEKRSEYGAGNINFNDGGGVSLFLKGNGFAELRFNQGKDNLVYYLYKK